MSFRLPPSDSPIRDLFAIEDVAAMADPAERAKLPDFRGLVRSLQDFVLNDERVESACGLCWRADGSLWLVRVGSRGGWSKVWNFGRF